MKWLGFPALALALVTGCDKTTPFEITAAGPRNQATPPLPMVDAGTALLDAQSSGSVTDAGAGTELPMGAFSKPALLKAIADCSLARYREFSERAAILRDVTSAWASNPSEELRLAAQNAWRSAMSSWQQSELFRFGPTGPAAEPAGKDYRNSIYFFPDINNCLVDRTLVDLGYAQVPIALNVSARGLAALEYLLFYSGPNNSCSSALTINTGSPSPWAMLDAPTLTARRAAYAGVLGADLALSAKNVVDAWAPDAGNFYGQFSGAGTAASSIYKTDQDAFNVIDNALFYVDKELKDFKLALPAGLSLDCTVGTCPEAVESRFSRASNANIVQNLRGFRLLYQGCGPNYNGFGFDDYLEAINKGDLAARLTNAIQLAQQSAETLPLPLDELLGTDLSRVLALHAAVKAISDLLKTEFVTALNLELPAAAQGDND